MTNGGDAETLENDKRRASVVSKRGGGGRDGMLILPKFTQASEPVSVGEGGEGDRVLCCDGKTDLAIAER